VTGKKAYYGIPNSRILSKLLSLAKTPMSRIFLIGNMDIYGGTDRDTNRVRDRDADTDRVRDTDTDTDRVRDRDRVRGRDMDRNTDRDTNRDTVTVNEEMTNRAT
jgi:hypothetical protein